MNTVTQRDETVRSAVTEVIEKPEAHPVSPDPVPKAVEDEQVTVMQLITALYQESR